MRAIASFVVFLGLHGFATARPGSNTTGTTPTTICTLRFDMDRWSPIFKYAEGQGVIRCDNGQIMNVSVKARGGGISAGNARIRNGVRSFSAVSDINQLTGKYWGVPASAGAINFAQANVVTNGEVSMMLARAGAGWSLGTAAGSFDIRRVYPTLVL